MQPDQPRLSPGDLRAWRMLTGLTQEAAALQLGVPLSSYAGWERGLPIRHPRLVALALAAIHEGMPPWQTPPDLVVEPPRRGRPRKAIVI